MRPFVDFYRENRISPVSQDISDLGRHFDRRAALYRHLGLAPALIKGRSVIEFGPGSGFNSIYTAAFSPARYVLVDGNPTGLDKTRDLLAEHARAETDWEMVESLIEDYASGERFEVVLCEGVIPFQIDPASFLRRVARFVAPGGILVITCADSVSVLPEALRRLVAAFVVDGEAAPLAKLEALRPIFRPHLATVKNMSRRHDDWILDVIIQPWVGSLLSISQAIETLDGGFDVYCSSPHFFTDWRWYKDIHGEGRCYNERAVEAYHENVHNLIDYRYTFEPRSPHINRKLIGPCEQVYRMVSRFGRDGEASCLPEIKETLRELGSATREFSAGTWASIDDFVAVLDAYMATGRLGDFGDFAPFFGRGQQYLSFIRR